MRIQFAAPLTMADGTELKQGEKPTQLVDPCIQVLDTVFQSEGQEGLKPKLRRAEMADKIAEAAKTLQPYDMLDADVLMLKERIGMMNYPPRVTAAIIRALETEVGVVAQAPKAEPVVGQDQKGDNTLVKPAGEGAAAAAA